MRPLLLLALFSCAMAMEPDESWPPPEAERAREIYDDLGNLTFPISNGSLAQQFPGNHVSEGEWSPRNPCHRFSPADLNIDPLNWRLSMDTSDFLHQSNHFYSFSSSRIMVDYRLCVVFFVFFGQPGRTKIWFGTIPLHERWQPGHLFFSQFIPSSHQSIHLFHVISLTQSIPKLAIWDS